MYQTSRRRKKKLSEEWVQWLLQCAMTSFPKSIQLTVHVLQSQQQVGPFWKCSAASTTAVFLLGKKTTTKNWIRMRRRMSAALQRDQPTRTNTNLSLPLDRIHTEPVLGCGSNKKITVERRNAYGRGLAGLVGSSRRWRLLLISHAIAITQPDRWLVPNEHQPPLRDNNQGSLWEI